MSATDRQNRLLVAEDWKKIYQTFRNADFKSYDFDNLRRTMIAYLRENYPEDFNDYIESSEYLALIDMIAFLGQNLAYRIDLNSRENFLELAERRESVLRLARLLSYNPKRNQAANGLLKIASVKTTEDIIDSSNINLRNQTILWNDPTNSNWFEQFIKIMNAALPVNGTFGRPNKKQDVSGIPTEQYRFNALNTSVPVYSFDKNIEGKNTKFQIVSTDIVDGELAEEPPLPGNNFAFLYRDDGRGPGSSNTGFFCHFRQGTLDSGEFTVASPTPNQSVAIDTPNINNSDIWLYKLDSNNNENVLWTKVDAVEGNNVIYNSLNKNIRTIYSVLTRVDDRINLIFADGVFGDLPNGKFRVYYRTSANRRQIISPSNMVGINFQIPYLSKTGQTQTLTITCELKYTVSNGSVSESTASIKSNAPSTYYTQNRMVTGEDYNVAPLGVSQEIVKAKAVNRTSSGISRYFDLLDATGKYSSTNLYGADGVIYRENLTEKTSFRFVTQTDIEGIIINQIEPILKSTKTRDYYLTNYPKVIVSDLDAVWQSDLDDTNRSTGKFLDSDDVAYKVGSFTANNLRFIEIGALCKFIPPVGSCFDKDNNVKPGNPVAQGDKTYIWSKVVRVTGDGTVTSIDTGLGPISFNDKIPDGARLLEIRQRLSGVLTDDVKTQIIDQAFAFNDFGLRYDARLRQWRIITNTNIDINSPFSTGKTGDISNQNLDASWLLLFETNGETYTVTSRGTRFVFESDREIRFYYDSTDKIFDSKTGKIIKDKIDVLSINTKPGSINLDAFTRDFTWEIVAEYRDKEGYVDTTKIQVSFFDADEDGVVDDLELFNEIVAPETTPVAERYVIQERFRTQDGTEDYRFIDIANLPFYIYATEGNVTGVNEFGFNSFSQYPSDAIFYFADTNVFKSFNADQTLLVLNTNYRAFLGRSNLKFHYIHSASESNRIDPSASNLIDIYMLTRQYDQQYRIFLNGGSSVQPLPPSSDQLFRDYGQALNRIKSISDEVIYHPVKYKVLFGPRAKIDLQSVFKIVKNPNEVLNDNDVKTRVIDAVNQYFALENWDFGDTFHFQELATYVMNALAPDLVTFVIVPRQVTQGFGSLFEIRSEADEIFINGATVDDVEIIDEITATKLQATGNVVTSSSINSGGIQSSAATVSNPNSGGLTY